jgi:cystathionine beta-lyase
MENSIFDIAPTKSKLAIKFKNHPRLSSDKSIIPMWIADMDFKSPQSVIDSMQEVVQNGIYGYTQADDDYNDVVANWYKSRMDWNINSDEILQTPGVMFAIASSIRALTNVGDSILICQPVYFPFANVITQNNRNLVVSNLVLNNGKYEMDFDDIENKIVKENVKMLLFCSPHNPVGRVWTKDELLSLWQICSKHGVIIISDEIHSDFIYSGNRHIPFASISDDIANEIITCTAPTKTFNLAGIQSSNIIIKNEATRTAVEKSIASTGYGHLNTLAYVATKTAYQYGSEWVDELVAYLEENVKILNQGLQDTPINLIKPQGTYLMWLDCRNMNLSDRELEKFFFEKAGLWLHNGFTFGKAGSGFVRMNIATQKATIEQAVKRIQNAL